MQNVTAPAWTDIGADKEQTAAQSFRMATEFKNIPLYKPPLPTQAKSPPGDLGLTRRLAEEIQNAENFARDAGGALYRFVGGVYKRDGADAVRRYVKRILEDENMSAKWNRRRADEVAEYIRVDAPELWERPPLDVLNLKNGLLDITSRQLSAHSPLHLSSVQIPVLYNPEARCLQWDSFVSQVFPADAQHLPWEIIAWLMRPDVSRQLAVLLLAEGANGKSTLLRGVTNFLGPANVAAISLHRLEADRFSVARLIGKLANISADLPASHLQGTSIFKSLTGNDTLLAERKYEGSFEFTPFARLLFSANHAPRSGDASSAFFRRWLVVPFPRTFGPGEEIPRPEMDRRLSQPEELSGVLNRALDAVEEVKDGRGLMETLSTRAAHEDFRRITDPLAVFLDQRTVEGSEVFVTKKILLNAYNQDAEKEGRPLMTANALSRALHLLRPRVVEAQRTVCGKVEWVWAGLGVVSSGEGQINIP